MDTEKIFTVSFWMLFASMLLMRFWFAFRVWRTGERLRADHMALQREGFGARASGWLFSLLLAALFLYLFRHGGSLGKFEFPAPDWLRWAGFALGLTSVGLFAWTHVTLGRSWSPYLQLRPGHRLMTTGPYARIRHPMYSAILGWLRGLGLVTANWTPFVFVAVGTLNFVLRSHGEERMMLEQFGDEYQEYQQRTGRLLPVW